MATAATATQPTPPPPSDDSGLDTSGIDEALQALQSQSQSDQDAEQRTAKMLSAEQQRLTQDSAGLDQLADEGAKALSTPAPAPPQPQKQSVFNTVIPLLMMSAFGGKGARANSQAMLGGMTGMVQGFNAGNEEQFQKSHQQYQEAYQRWLDNQTQMEKVYDLYRDAYKGRIDADQKALDSMMASLKEQEGNRRMSLQDWANLQATKSKIIAQHDNQQKTDAYHKAMLDIKRKQLEQQFGKGVMQPGSQAYDHYVRAIAAYRVPMPNISAYSMKDPATREWAEQLTADVTKANSDYTAQNYQRSQKTRDAFATGRQGDQVRSYNVLVQHLDVLDNLVQALGTGNVRAFNAAAQEFQKQFGGTAPTNFDAAKAFVADEITKAVLGAQGALGDRQTAQDRLQRSNSPQQLQQAIDIYRRLAGGQLNGLQAQYESGIGVPSDPAGNDFAKTMNLSQGAQELMKLSGAPENAAGAQEGARATSASGKPIVFHNGQWVYAQQGAQ